MAPAADEAGCAPHVEVSEYGPFARLRAHTDALRECTIDEPTYIRLVADWARSPGEVRALGLGRAVRHPWLSRRLALLALDDPAWDAGRGRPRAGHPNVYLEGLLEREPLAGRLAAPLAGSSLTLVGVSVEKVLVAPVGETVPGTDGGTVPFDVMIWLELGPR